MVYHTVDKERNEKMFRWVSIPMALFLELVAGTAYCFGAYSGQLKSAYQMSQSNLNAVSSIGNIGMYIALPGGLLLDNYGPRLTVFVGATISVIGYTLAWLSSMEILPKKYELLCIFMFMAWHGCSYLDCTAVPITVNNFSHNRGLVLGLIKSFFGLSGAIFAQVYMTFFMPVTDSKHSSNIGPLLVIIFGVANCVGRMLAGFGSDKLQYMISRPVFYGLEFLIMATGLLIYALSPDNSVGPCPPARHGDASHMPIFLFLGITIFIIAGIAGLIIKKSPALTKMSRLGRLWVIIGYIIVLLLSIFLAIIGFLQNNWKSQGTFHQHHDTMVAFTVIMGVMMISLLCVSFGGCQPNASIGDEEGLVKSMRVSESDQVTNEFTTIENLTTCQAVQRLNFWMIWWPQFVGTGCGLMIINNLGQIGLSYGKSFQLIAATVLIGISYGGLWSLNPTLIVEHFGRDNLGSNYAVCNFAPALGSYAISVGLAASIYNSHKYGKTCCLGTSCYKTTFLTTACLCVFSACIVFILAYRSRKFYSRFQI